MAIAFRSFSSNIGTYVVDKPTGATTGDALLVGFCYAGSGGTQTLSHASFTSVQKQTTTGGAATMEVFRRVVAGGDPASWTFTGSGDGFQGWVGLCWSGTDGTTPVDVSSKNAGAAASTITGSTVTVTNNSSQLVWFYGQDASYSTANRPVPSGFTARADDGFVLIQAADKSVNSGATGSITSTQSGANADWIVIMVALAPSGGGGGGGGRLGHGSFWRMGQQAA